MAFRETPKRTDFYREQSTANVGAAVTALAPVEGYGASEMRFGLFVGVVAAAGAVAWFMIRKPKNGGRRRRRRR